MALGDRLSRYHAFARLLARYSRADLHAAGAADSNDGGLDSDQLAADLEALGPTFIKLGQVLSTRADLLPPATLEALGRLQDDVAPVAYEEVERVVEEELGVRISRAFASFEREPLAAASLGQVHRATLRGGRAVAVKVQRPNVRERVLEDLAALDDVAALLERFTQTARKADIRRILDEFRRTLLAELDYRQEARNMVTLSEQLRGFNRIRVPMPVDDYTSSRVLTMDYIVGTKVTKVSPVEWTEIDGPALADELFEAYLHQILADGTFHADPHPGNVLLTTDHRLALIDVGMVGRLSEVLQERLFRLMLAISEARGDEAATIVVQLGEPLETFNEPQLRRTVAELVGRYRGAVARDLNVGRVLLEMVRSGHECGLRLSPELALLGKTLLNLDEIGRTIDPEFDVNASMRQHAARLMRERMLRTLSPATVFSSMMELRELLQRLPGRVNRVLDALAASDLRVKVEVIDQGSILSGFQKVANRIALGLVLAALIVGAAMLMQVPTAFTILGYPGIAMLLFLCAAAGGFWMAWTIVAGDVRRTKG